MLALAVLGLGAAPAQAAPAFGFTTNAFQDHGVHSPHPAHLSLLGRLAGANVERIAVEWKAVQRFGPKSWNWSRYREAVDEMIEDGVQPLLMLTDAPEWADDSTCNAKHCPPGPNYNEHWGRFAAAAAVQFPEAYAIEIWNAPNTKGYWNVAGGPNPGRYAEIFKWAARSIHEAVPGTMVLFPSIGYSFRGDRVGILSIETFLRRFYNAIDSFRPNPIQPQDALSFHPYPSKTELETLDGQYATAKKQLYRMRNLRDPGRKVWVTEVGISTTGKGAPNETQQALGLLRVVRDLEATPDMEGIIVHTLYEPRYNKNYPIEQGYGIIERKTYRVKHAFCVFAKRAGTSQETLAAFRVGCEPWAYNLDYK